MEKAKTNPVNFTRDKKIGFVPLILLIINVINRTIQVEKLISFVENLQTKFKILTLGEIFFLPSYANLPHSS